MRFSWSNHLQVKTNSALLLMAFGIAIMFFVLIYPIEANRTADQLTRVRVLLETIYKQKKDDISNAIFNGQHFAIEKILREIDDIVTEIDNACLYDQNGNIRYCSSFPQPIPMDLRPDINGKTLKNFGIFTQGKGSFGGYLNDIENIGERVGCIGIYYDVGQILEGKRMLVSLTTVMFIFGVLIILLLLNVFLRRSILIPLNDLRQGMKRVAEGNLGETVSLFRKDEFGDMETTFNEMSFKLLQNRQDLGKHQIHLEELVRKRTEALTVAKELAEAMGERQREQWELLKTVMETIPSPMFYKDVDGRYVGCNMAFEEFLGRHRNDILGKTVYELFPQQLANLYTEKDLELIGNPGRQSYTLSAT